MSIIIGFAVLLVTHIIVLCLGCMVGLVVANEINHKNDKEDESDER